MVHRQKFYQDVRPFLAAWNGGGSVLPDGLRYEGVDAKPRCVVGRDSCATGAAPVLLSVRPLWYRKYAGGSAAQSSLFAALDEGLGLTIGRDAEGGFLASMRKYGLAARVAVGQSVGSPPQFASAPSTPASLSLCQSFMHVLWCLIQVHLHPH